MAPSNKVEDAAVFSEDRKYRYFLSRELLFGEGTMSFLMLNPSTADEAKNDATIRRCVNFAKRENCNKLQVVNLSPFRATHPQDLFNMGPDPDDVWKINREWIITAAETSKLFVAAYGDGGTAENRAREVMDLLERRGQQVLCLGTTKSGYPLHPLRLRANTPLVPYKAPVV